MRAGWMSGLGVAVFAAALLASLVVNGGPRLEAQRPDVLDSRSVRVALDATLAADGAWKLGENAPPPDSRFQAIEVEAEALDARALRVAVQRHSRAGFVLSDEFWFDLSRPDTPTVRASSRSHEVETANTWELRDLEGVVRMRPLASQSESGADSSILRFDYELTGEGSGSKQTMRGSVAIRLADLR